MSARLFGGGFKRARSTVASPKLGLVPAPQQERDDVVPLVDDEAVLEPFGDRPLQVPPEVTDEAG